MRETSLDFNASSRLRLGTHIKPIFAGVKSMTNLFFIGKYFLWISAEVASKIISASLFNIAFMLSVEVFTFKLLAKAIPGDSLRIPENMTHSKSSDFRILIKR